MKPKHPKRKGQPGFTLIEVMITVGIMGIFIGLIIPVQVQVHRLAESEVGLQKAIQVLRNEVEVLRVMPYDDLTPGHSLPFHAQAKGLDKLVAGRGEVHIERDPRMRGLLQLRVEVHWRDARLGMRSVHTELYKAP